MAFLGQVDAFGAGGEPAEQCQPQARPDLDDEDPPGRDRGLPDLVHVGDDAVQRGVAADAQFGAGDVVVDRHRQADDRDVQGWVVVPVPVQFVCGLVSGPAAGDEEPVDVVGRELAIWVMPALSG